MTVSQSFHHQRLLLLFLLCGVCIFKGFVSHTSSQVLGQSTPLLWFRSAEATKLHTLPNHHDLHRRVRNETFMLAFEAFVHVISDRLLQILRIASRSSSLEALWRWLRTTRFEGTIQGGRKVSDFPEIINTK